MLRGCARRMGKYFINNTKTAGNDCSVWTAHHATVPQHLFDSTSNDVSCPNIVMNSWHFEAFEDIGFGTNIFQQQTSWEFARKCIWSLPLWIHDVLTKKFWRNTKKCKIKDCATTCGHWGIYK